MHIRLFIERFGIGTGQINVYIRLFIERFGIGTGQINVHIKAIFRTLQYRLINIPSPHYVIIMQECGLTVLDLAKKTSPG